MNKRGLLWTLCGGFAFSIQAAPTITVTADIDKITQSQGLTFLQATDPALRFNLISGGRPYRDLAGYTGKFIYGTNLNSVAYVTITSTNVSPAGSISFQFDGADINTNGTFAAALILQDDQTNNFFYGEYELTIKASAMATGAGAITMLDTYTLTQDINAATYSITNAGTVSATTLEGDGSAITGITGFLTSAGLNTEAELESQIGSLGAVDLINSDDLNTEAELESQIGSVNILVSDELNTEAELESQIGSVNVLIDSELQNSADLAGLLMDETGTGSVIFGTGPELARQVVALTGSDTLTTAEAMTSMVTVSGAATVTLPTGSIGMEVFILLIDDVAVNVSDGDGGSSILWKDGQLGDTITAGSAGESVHLIFDGSVWRAVLVEGSWILS